MRAELTGHADDPLAELAEEMAVDRAAARAARDCGRVVCAVRFVQEDEVEIAVIVRLAAAELAEGQHDQLAAVAFAAGEALPMLAADFVRQLLFARPADRRHAELVDPASRTRASAICLRQASAMSASAACVERMSSLPRMSRTPTRRCWAFLKLCRIGSMSSAPWHSSASASSSIASVGSLLDQQAVHQLVDHARVAGEDAGQIRAGGAQLHVQVERRRIEAEQLPQHRLAAERIADRLRFTSVESGSGVAAIAASSRGAIAARKCRQRRVERKRIFSVASAIRF